MISNISTDTSNLRGCELWTLSYSNILLGARMPAASYSLNTSFLTSNIIQIRSNCVNHVDMSVSKLNQCSVCSVFLDSQFLLPIWSLCS